SLCLRRAPPPTPFPYTTLFRSPRSADAREGRTRREDERQGSRTLACPPRKRSLHLRRCGQGGECRRRPRGSPQPGARAGTEEAADRKSTRLNSSHVKISYAVFC